jgi:hypothetical protein
MKGIQIVRRLRAALILQAVPAPAKLATFRRIDSPKANARSVDFQTVAIDDAGLSRKITGRGNCDRSKDWRRKCCSDLEQVVDCSLIFEDAVDFAH